MGHSRKNMIVWAMMMSLLGLSCHTHGFLIRDLPLSRSDCMDIFVKINHIQEKRNNKMDTMARYTRAFKSGVISRWRFHNKRESWLLTERRLRTEAAHLYDIGYEHGCFDENK
jgi:hypothetical protein